MNQIGIQRSLVTGGTGSIGRHLVKRLLDGGSKVIVFSRDEAKQHDMCLEFGEKDLSFVVGDVRDYDAIEHAMEKVDVVFHVAALKHVPVCELHPYEAIQTNVLGAVNIVKAIQKGVDMDAVVGISTDKACQPNNVMGLTKALQERIFIQANGMHPFGTRFVCVRFGNVLASRGSVIQTFKKQIEDGGPITITDPRMTRFLITLDDAVDTILAVYHEGQPGEIFVPTARAATLSDIAAALIDRYPPNNEVLVETIGPRPGEKTHEVLFSEEEWPYVRLEGTWKVITLKLQAPTNREPTKYSSEDNLMTYEEVKEMLSKV